MRFIDVTISSTDCYSETSINFISLLSWLRSIRCVIKEMMIIMMMMTVKLNRQQIIMNFRTGHP